MPTNVVKTPIQEQAWERAKQIVNKQYPDITSQDPRYYKLVMGIYERIVGRRPKTNTERKQTHQALFGKNSPLPPRGTGLSRSKFIVNKKAII